MVNFGGAGSSRTPSSPRQTRQFLHGPSSRSTSIAADCTPSSVREVSAEIWWCLRSSDLKLGRSVSIGLEYVRCGRWIPWSLLVMLTVLAAASAVVGATANRGEPTRPHLISPFFTPARTLKTVPENAPTTLLPEAGYRGIENFCAAAPLTGAIHYEGTSGGLTGVLTVNVGGLPPNDAVNVNWSNDHVRVPVIASFEADSKGAAIQSSVDVRRLGEVRGVEIVLTAARVPNPVLGRLEPC